MSSNNFDNLLKWMLVFKSPYKEFIDKFHLRGISEYTQNYYSYLVGNRC